MTHIITLRRCPYYIIAFLLLTVGMESRAFAQNGGYGGDMWTRRMEQDGLFELHYNFCSGSEAFIAVAADGKGFCMDEDQRTADTFDDARQDCFDEGKRLPEPVEFKYACRYGAGLNDMTDDWEWVSNFPIIYRWVGESLDALVVPVLGLITARISRREWSQVATPAVTPSQLNTVACVNHSNGSRPGHKVLSLAKDASPC